MSPSLRSNDRFLADEAIEEPDGVRHRGARHAKAGKDRLRLGVAFGGVCVYCEGRNGRRQRIENEVVNLLSGRG